MLLMADVIIGNRAVVWGLEHHEQGSTVTEPLGHACVWHLGEPAGKVRSLVLSEWEHAQALCPTLSLKSCSWGKGRQLEGGLDLA